MNRKQHQPITSREKRDEMQRNKERKFGRFILLCLALAVISAGISIIFPPAAPFLRQVVAATLVLAVSMSLASVWF